MHDSMVMEGNQGGASSVEKVIMMLICLCSTNQQVLKSIPPLVTNIGQVMQSTHQKMKWQINRTVRKSRKPKT